MKKRGQATIFVIFGIFLLALVLLLFFLRAQLFGEQVQINLDESLVPMEDHIKTCLTTIGEPLLHRLGAQGGYLNLAEDTYALYNTTRISYLCYNREDGPTCYNRMLTIEAMEEELSEAMEEALPTCLNLNKFKKGLQLSMSTQQMITSIGDDTVLFTLHMPVVLKRNQFTLQRNNFTQTIPYPLGLLYKVSKDIIAAESATGTFDYLAYVGLHKGQVLIKKKQPYPDKLFILKKRNQPYIFQFLIQGEPAL